MDMDEEKKKEFIKRGAGLKVGILYEFIKSGKRCICEEGEHCSINAALDFLKKHPEVPVEELATLIAMFELSLLESQDLEYVAHASPLEILSQEGEESKDEEKDKMPRMVIDDEMISELKDHMQQHLEQSIKEGGCNCNSGYCFFNAAAGLMKEFNIPIEKVVELMVFSELKAFEASKLMERGTAVLIVGKEAEIVDWLNDTREKISAVLEAINLPGKIRKKWLKGELLKIIEELETEMIGEKEESSMPGGSS